MQAWNELVLSLAQPCRLAIEIGVTVLLRSGMMLSAVLTAGFFLRGRHPAVRANFDKLGIAAVSLLCLITVLSLGRGPARWTFSLSQSLPRSAGSDVNMEAVVPPEATTRTSDPAPLPAVGNGGMGLDTAIASEQAPRAGLASTADMLAVMLCILWITGVLVSAAWLVLSRARVAAVCDRAVPPVDMAIRDELHALCKGMRIPCPLLLASHEVVSPFVTGTVQPCLVLPETLIGLPDVQTRRAVLAHELQHLKAHDVQWTLLASLFCMLLWPQPLAFLLVRRWRDASEEACDLAALHHNCSPQRYARCLVSIAEAMAWGGPERAARVGMALSRSSLGRRVEQILKYRTRSFHRLTLPSAASILFVFGLTFLMTFRLVSAGAADQRGVTAATAPFAATGAAPAAESKPPADRPLTPDAPVIAVQPPEQDNAELTKQQDLSRKELEAAQRELQRERAEVERATVARKRVAAETAELRARLQMLDRNQRDAAYKAGFLAKSAAMLRGAGDQEESARELAMLQKELADQKGALLQLQSRYAPNHPKMLQAQAAAKELQTRIEDYWQSRARNQPHRSSSGNRSQQTSSARHQEALDLERTAQLKANLIAMQAQVQVQQAEMQRAAAQLRADQARKADETALLKAEIAQLKAQLDSYRKQREESEKTGK